MRLNLPNIRLGVWSKSAILVLCTVFFTNCNEKSEDQKKNSSSVRIVNRNELKAQWGSPIAIQIETERKIDKLSIFYSDSLIHSFGALNTSGNIELSTSSLGVGKHTVSLEYECDGTLQKEILELNVLSTIKPQILKTKVIAEYNHKETSFTQGLEFFQNTLYEGTGDPTNSGNTFIAKVNYQTGEHLKTIKGNPEDFGEGITILNDKLYQLTWQQNKCYVYDLNTFEKTAEFSYGGEGWGLTNDGKVLIMSDGSQTIYFRDPASFDILKKVQVSTDVSAVTFLNELECVEGKLYANVWMKDLIVEIDQDTGEVKTIIDCKELRTKVDQISTQMGRQRPEVLNGIAFNQQSESFFLTGKFWPRMYEVQFVKN